MMALESTVVATWTGVDPTCDTEFLLTAWSDGSRTVATRVADSGEGWGPQVGLVPETVPGRCPCRQPGCSDAGWQR